MRRWVFMASWLAAAGCGERVERLVVSPVELLLTSQGQEASLTTTALDRNGRPLASRIMFSSSDETVVTVTGQGKVTVHKSGDATVSARAGVAQARIDVRVRIPSLVSIEPETLRLSGLGATAKLAARVLDEEGREIPGAAVTWRVDGPQCASVLHGTVTALGVGECRVHASFGSMAAVANLAVEWPAFESLLLEPPALSMTRGQTDFVLASTIDAGGNRVGGVPIDFSSDSPHVATVDSNGQVTGISPGLATVTVRAGERVAAVPVRVTGG